MFIERISFHGVLSTDLSYGETRNEKQSFLARYLISTDSSTRPPNHLSATVFSMGSIDGTFGRKIPLSPEWEMEHSSGSTKNPRSLLSSIACHLPICISSFHHQQYLIAGQSQIRQCGHHSGRVRVSSAPAPALDADDHVALVEDPEFDRLGDAPFQAAVDILLPVHFLEIRFFFGEVEGVDAAVEMRVLNGGEEAGLDM